MKVQIKETGEIKNLESIVNGIDCAPDILGNFGETSNGQFELIDDSDVYLAGAEAFVWWETFFREEREIEDEIEKLADDYGLDYGYVRNRVHESAYYYDMEDRNRIQKEEIEKIKSDFQAFAS